MTLELTPNFESGWSNRNMGGLATWFDSDWTAMWNKFQNRTTWWYDGNADIFYGVNDNKACVQFGCDRSDYASARGFYQTINIQNEVVNSDNSIDADLSIGVSLIMGYKTTHSSAGYPAETSVRLGAHTLCSRTGNTIDSFRMDPNPVITNIHVHVPPQQKAQGTDLVYHTHYPTGVYPDSNIKLGLTVYNPLPPSYKPMSIRKGTWKSLDDNNGFIRIRHGGNWQDKAEENATTSMHDNTGHNRIRRDSVWKQLPRM